MAAANEKQPAASDQNQTAEEPALSPEELTDAFADLLADGTDSSGEKAAASAPGDRKSSGLGRPSGAQGLSLDELSDAFAEMLTEGQDPYDAAEGTEDDPPVESAESSRASADTAEDDDPCEITPRSILEAMLFVGQPDGSPLTSEAVAALMRGVRAAEVDALVRDLNEQYEANGCPYHVESFGAGYRLALCDRFAHVRDRFYGKMRDARLSQAAIDVLAIVAYNQRITGDDVTKLRGTPSNSILSQLVRRQLLSIERPPKKKPRVSLYSTTQRFLELFALKSLDDLPRPQDVEKK